MNRRLLLACAPALVLAGCSTFMPYMRGVTLPQLKAYVSDLVGAMGAAGQAFIAAVPTPAAAQQALVATLIADLDKLNRVLQSAIDDPTVKGSALQILAGVNQLMPLVLGFLGSAGAAVPIAVAVIQAFIQSLPPPPDAPAAPPEALHRLSLHYRPRR